MSVFGAAPIALRRAISSRERIVIRLARAQDEQSLKQLAGLADRPLPPAPLLLAEADGALVAVVSKAGGVVIRDPFVASDDVVALLQLRASQLDQAA